MPSAVWSGVKGVQWSALQCPVECGVQWRECSGGSAVERSSAVWSGLEGSGVHCSGVEVTGLDFTGLERCGVDWAGAGFS